MDRSKNLERIRSRREPWDIIVIGGGATGAGCAVDAASRGIDVLLLEQSDFGKGTSSRSTKLVHGGVRYLAQGNIPLVREALKERWLLLHNAPHIVKRQEFIVPCYSLWQTIYYATGLKLYDLLAWRYGIGKSRVLNRRQVLDRIPGLKPDGLRGGVSYYDCRFDDTRLLLELVKTADANKAVVMNYAKVTSFSRNDLGAIDGVEFQDVEDGASYTASARRIVNATGVFSDSIRKLAEPNAQSITSLSRGTHLVLGRQFMPAETALLIPKTVDGRVLFVIPWLDHVLVGTTDISINHPDLEPRASDDEIDFILDTAGRYLTSKPGRSDILSVFAGIRPLVRSEKKGSTASLSRDHFIEADDSIMLTITGGKWTTYRKMAADAIDRSMELGGFAGTLSKTESLKIGDQSPSGAQDDGSFATNIEEHVRRFVREEMALTVEDVLARRTRVLFTDADAAVKLAPQVAAIMAAELGRDKQWTSRQIEDFGNLARSYLP